MAVTRYLSKELMRGLRRPGFWFILLVLVLITLIHYSEVLRYPSFLPPLMADLGLDRHAFERVLYLAPIVWAGFLFGWRGAFITSLFALAGMLPRAIFVSLHPVDALFETAAVFVIGNVLAISFASLRKEREYRTKLEVAQQEQQKVAEELREMQENLHFYLQQAARAQEDERKRISRELHDETIQALVTHARQLDKLASDGKGLSDEKRLRLEELHQQINSIMEGLRRLGQDLRPPSLDHLGLLPALEWLASDVAGYSGIVTKVNVVGKERRLPEEVEIVLFRITQEALRNVWRHSGATSAEITVEFDESKTGITVSDNGVGFNLPENIGNLARDGRLGLVGMQERAQLIGGTLTVKSQPDEGTSITVELPV